MNIDDQIKLIEHLKAGFNNSQEVAKSLDAKAGVISGFAFLLASGIISTAKWMVEQEPSLVFSGCIHRGAFLVSSTILIGSVLLSWVFTVNSIVGRRKNGSFHILFPVHTKKETAMVRSILYGDSMNPNDLELREYREQIDIMGGILEKKIRHTRHACMSLIVAIVAITVWGTSVAWFFV